MSGKRSTAAAAAIVAGVLVVGAAGTATAARLITGQDIKNGSVTGKDIKDGTISEKDLSKSVKSQLGQGGGQGAQGVAGPQGPQGEQGPSGSVIKVYDANSTVVGDLVSGDFSLTVFDKGGLWTYAGNGRLISTGEPTLYRSSDCSGPAYAAAFDRSIGLAGSPIRVVERFPDGAVGAWEYTNNTIARSNVMSSYESGSCSSFTPGSWLKDLVELKPIATPSDRPGPLTIR